MNRCRSGCRGLRRGRRTQRSGFGNRLGLDRLWRSLGRDLRRRLFYHKLGFQRTVRCRFRVPFYFWLWFPCFFWFRFQVLDVHLGNVVGIVVHLLRRNVGFGRVVAIAAGATFRTFRMLRVLCLFAFMGCVVMMIVRMAFRRLAPDQEEASQGGGCHQQ